MTTESFEIDRIDRSILMALQNDASLSQRALAEEVGLSQNACWRRLQRLQSEGVLRGQRATVDLARLGLDLVVIVMIKTPHHSKDWAIAFKDHVSSISGVVDLYRIGGEWDYLIKVITQGIESVTTGFTSQFGRRVRSIGGHRTFRDGGNDQRASGDADLRKPVIGGL